MGIPQQDTIPHAYIPPLIQNPFHSNPDKDRDSDFDSQSVECITSPTPYAPLYPSEALRAHQKQILRDGKDLESQRLIPTGSGATGPTKTSWLGILLAFLSGVFFTLSSGIIKYLTDVDPMELLIWRAFIQVKQNLKKVQILRKNS